MVQLTTGQAIVQSLLRQGVDTVFGMPGVQTYDLFDAFYDRGQNSGRSGAPRTSGGLMAYGYARSTGKVVCSVVPGPGVLNTMSALCTAQGSNVPLVCLTSEIPTDFQGKGRRHLHEIRDQLGTLRSLIKWAEQCDAPEAHRLWSMKPSNNLKAGGQGLSLCKCPGMCWVRLAMLFCSNLRI